MSRVPPTPVQILVGDDWVLGMLRTCEVTPDGQSCSGVVSFGHANCTATARIDATRMRTLTGEPGCPAAHQDNSGCA